MSYRSATGIVVLILSLLILTPNVRAATHEQVEAAIAKAKNFLYSQQNAEGHWDALKPDENGNWDAQRGGWTAIAVYALLASGESYQDERIKKGLKFLDDTTIQGIYALGLRAQVYPFLPPTPERKIDVKRDGDLLMLAANEKREHWGYGLYHYTTAKDGGWHHSPAQYGVLGAWAVQQAGYEVPKQYWQAVDEGWRKNQFADGGWTYSVPMPTWPDPKWTEAEKAAHAPRPSMTAAGVATLFITQDYLHAGEGIGCKGNIENESIEKGLKWMADNFNRVGGDLYTLYGVERIGVASGYKYFGDVDWYATGSDTLVKGQAGDGHWNNHGPIPGTAFGILFLVRGRAPVVFSKLDYDLAEAPATATRPSKPAAAAKPNPKAKKPEEPPAKPVDPKEGNWNQRPRDVANLVKWIGHQTERDLNWQIVNLNRSADELLDAPILYIAGNQAITLTAEQKAKLKEYCEAGGIILGNADCASQAFAGAFEKLGLELFPAYKWEDIKPDHPIYKHQQFNSSKWRSQPGLKGLSNGTREFMLLVPNTDPAKTWQMDAQARNELFEVAANIFLYAIDKRQLRFKGQTYLVKVDPKIKADREITVARLQYNGNWDPEPGGWRRLAAVMNNQDKVVLAVQTVKLGEGKLASAGHKIAHLTGTARFKFDEAQRKELKDFLAAGNTLVVDAAGGKGEFAEAVENELRTILSVEFRPLESTLPDTHDVYKSATDKKPIEVNYRGFARNAMMGDLKGPRLKGAATKASAGKLAVIYSREDLSTGLVGQPVDGIIGYTPESATTLMSRILLYSAFFKPAPSTQPAAAAAPKK